MALFVVVGCQVCAVWCGASSHAESVAPLVAVDDNRTWSLLIQLIVLPSTFSCLFGRICFPTSFVFIFMKWRLLIPVWCRVSICRSRAIHGTIWSPIVQHHPGLKCVSAGQREIYIFVLLSIINFLVQMIIVHFKWRSTSISLLCYAAAAGWMAWIAGWHDHSQSSSFGTDANKKKKRSRRGKLLSNWSRIVVSNRYMLFFLLL